MTEAEKPALLAMLQATVDDETVFEVKGVPDSEAFKQELREAWAHLYDNAANAWKEAFQPEESGTQELVGPEMCRRYMALSSDWLQDFIRAIVKTGKRRDLPGKTDREFLYVMIGVLMASWQAYLALRHGKIDPAGYRE